MTLNRSPLIEWSDKGLYCRLGNFYIDPHKSVDTAVITHAHSDHARKGSRHYLCESSGVELLKTRLGKNIKVRGYSYRDRFQLGDIQVSFHAAGHILGSSQIRLQYRDETWVISGDYKRELDPSCEPFEVVPCDIFITEATFGTPKYVWNKEKNHGNDIYNWWMKNSSTDTNSVLFGYSLGKAQRILGELAPFAKRPILIHESIVELTDCYRNEGITLAPTCALETQIGKTLKGELILAPPSILSGPFFQCLGQFQTAFASGWMQGSNYVHNRAYDHGFVLSDHADWNDINLTIEQTGAKQVFVLHRSNGILVRHLRKRGIDAHPVTALTLENYIRIPELNLSLF